MSRVRSKVCCLILGAMAMSCLAPATADATCDVATIRSQENAFAPNTCPTPPAPPAPPPTCTIKTTINIGPPGGNCSNIAFGQPLVIDQTGKLEFGANDATIAATTLTVLGKGQIVASTGGIIRLNVGGNVDVQRPSGTSIGKIAVTATAASAGGIYITTTNSGTVTISGNTEIVPGAATNSGPIVINAAGNVQVNTNARLHSPGAGVAGTHGGAITITSSGGTVNVTPSVNVSAGKLGGSLSLTGWGAVTLAAGIDGSTSVAGAGNKGGSLTLQSNSAGVSLQGTTNLNGKGSGNPCIGGGGGTVLILGQTTVSVSGSVSAKGAQGGSGGSVAMEAVNGSVLISNAIDVTTDACDDTLGDRGEIVVVSDNSTITVNGTLTATGHTAILTEDGVVLDAAGNVTTSARIKVDSAGPDAIAGVVTIGSGGVVTLGNDVTADGDGEGGTIAITGTSGVTVNNTVSANGPVDNGGSIEMIAGTNLVSGDVTINGAARAPNGSATANACNLVIGSSGTLTSEVNSITVRQNVVNTAGGSISADVNIVHYVGFIQGPLTPPVGNPATTTIQHPACDQLPEHNCVMPCRNCTKSAGGNLAVDTPCNDTNPCTTPSKCNNSGVCLGGGPRTCTGDQCRYADDACDTVNGCVDPPKPDQTPCNDNNSCTPTDTCEAGECVGHVPPCPPPSVCHYVVWNCATQMCQEFPISGLSCSDGNDCTTNDQCLFGNCLSGTPKPPGSSCNDGDACTTNETCNSNVCNNGSPVTCNDGKSTTVDSCNPSTGCEFKYTPLQRMLTIPSTDSADRVFGVSLAALNGALVVRVADRINGQGQVVLAGAYRFNPTTGQLLQTYAPPTGTTSPTFAPRVTVVNGTVLTSDPYAAVGGGGQTGAAFLYGGSLQTFTPATGSGFGAAVSGLATTFLITNPGISTAYLMTPPSTTPTKTYTSPSMVLGLYAGGIAAVGNLVVTGPAVNAIDVFDMTTTVLARSIATPDANDFGILGQAIVTSGTNVLVSSYQDGGEDMTGYAYLIDPTINQVNPMDPVVKTFTKTFPGASGLNAKWGWAVADDIDRVAITAPYLWGGTGEVYIYDRDFQGPPIQTLTSPYAVPVDTQGFGIAVVSIGHSLAVGHQVEAGGYGEVHIYSPCGDGVVDAGELCDDGNSIDNDACPNDCR